MAVKGEESSGLRILIVEDDLVSRVLLTRILSTYGLCDVAVNGEEAIECFKLAQGESHPYDLVCLDIMMPNMDGQQVLKRIRELEEQAGIGGLDGVKVVMITALDDPENVLGAFRSGCEAYVVKPIDKNKLLETVRKVGIALE